MASITTGLITKINPGNGTNYNFASSAYGECSTDAMTAAKTVEMTGFTLIKGITVFIKFTNSNLAEAPTLNVNGTGAKPIVLYGTTNSDTTEETTGWWDGAILALTYDGTSWVRNTGYNTDTHYESALYAGTGSASNTTATNGNVKLALVENGSVRSSIGIKGATATSVTSDANGNIIVSSHDTTYTFTSGTAGSFSVTPAGSSAQTVSIGKPATAGVADSAGSAGYATTAGNAQYAGTASQAITAGNAVNAAYAVTATWALDGRHASSADYATNANNANNATYASSAGYAIDSSKVAKAGDTMSGNLVLGVAGEAYVSVNNTLASSNQGHEIQLVSDTDGNIGLQDASILSGTDKRWIVKSASDGKSYFYGLASCATWANAAGTADFAKKAGQDGDGNTISSTYLKTTGGTMTGGINFSVDSSSFNTKGITFGASAGGGHIGVNTSGNMGIYAKGKIVVKPSSEASASNEGIEVTSDGLIPTNNNSETLGDASHKWVSVYATTFNGALAGGASSAVYAASAGAFSSNKSITLTGDVTGTASSTGGWSITTTLADNGVTTGSYGLSADTTAAYAGSFTVPYITVDSKGRITSISDNTVTLPASNNTDQAVLQNAVTPSSYTYWRSLLFGASASSTEGFSPTTITTAVFATSTLSAQPSTGTIRANIFSMGGNAMIQYNSTTDAIDFVFA